MLSPQSANGTDLLKVNNSKGDMEEEEQSVFTGTKKISIIIPAYNEESRIGQTIKDLEANIPFISEILVIFDGKDRTPEVAMRSGKKVKVLSYNDRLGHGGAVFEGIKQARGDIICFIDADGSSPAFEVNRVCSLVNDNTPAVFGSRWSVGSKIIQRESLRNLVGGRVYHYMAFVILGVKVKDSFCGLKAFKKDLALDLVKRITLTDRTFNIAIAYNLKLMGYEPLEIGIEWSHKQGTQLPVGIKVIAIMFLTLIGLKIAHSAKITGFKIITTNFRKKIRFY